jgi:hypothetical protein
MIRGEKIPRGLGARPSSGYKGAGSESEGRYDFSDLPNGTYCVKAIHTLPRPIEIPGVSVNLAHGKDKTAGSAVPW